MIPWLGIWPSELDFCCFTEQNRPKAEAAACRRNQPRNRGQPVSFTMVMDGNSEEDGWSSPAICQHLSASVSICQHLSASVSICQHLSPCAGLPRLARLTRGWRFQTAGRWCERISAARKSRGIKKVFISFQKSKVYRLMVLACSGHDDPRLSFPDREDEPGKPRRRMSVPSQCRKL